MQTNEGPNLSKSLTNKAKTAKSMHQSNAKLVSTPATVKKVKKMVSHVMSLPGTTKNASSSYALGNSHFTKKFTFNEGKNVASNDYPPTAS